MHPAHSIALTYLNLILFAAPHVSWIILVCMKDVCWILRSWDILVTLEHWSKCCECAWYALSSSVEHCKAQRWITVFAKCLLHFFRYDVEVFEKWVNADSQFLTFVVTVLGISA